MSDESLWVDPVPCFEAVGSLRSSYQGVALNTSVQSPDVGNTTTTETLSMISGLIGGLPSAVAVQMDLIANAITLGAMDAIRADNPCLNWNAPPPEDS